MLSGKFWAGKRVLLTGHTGFKGGWLAAWLNLLDCEIRGIGLLPCTSPSFFDTCGIAERVYSIQADIRDRAELVRLAGEFDPEIIFHLAAQPIVRRSYLEPLETLDVNVMGTACVLEAARQAPSLRAVVVITSDKCYHNRGWVWGYREDEPMGGRDPYSASKGCAELVAAAYQHSFFRNTGATIATTRAGNVIGGGDWAEDRIVPDAIRAFSARRELTLRNPHAVRPWQHVLEPLSGYLKLAEQLFFDSKWQGGWNFGPAETDAVPVSALAGLLTTSWGSGASWRSIEESHKPHEEPYLKLDSSKARSSLGWHPRLGVREAVEWSVDWYRKYYENPAGGMWSATVEQIRRYQELP